MKLSVKAFALSSAIIWALCLFMVITLNMITDGYGAEFLKVMGSIYPGYHSSTGITSIIVGSLYGFVDAGIGGLVFAWLYNLFVKES